VEKAKRDGELNAQAKRESENAAAARREADQAAAEAKRLAALAAADASKKSAASACEVDLRSTANSGSVQFERASDVLLKQSLATVRRLADVAKSCANVLIEIEGHTDSEGVPERNQPLSERRAQSVVNYLVEHGVDAARIKAIGYGDTKPIAPNDTADNRAKNRRIEFSVKSQ
jgi:OmpA-OmpF porin, OOP family